MSKSLFYNTVALSLSLFLEGGRAEKVSLSFHSLDLMLSMTNLHSIARLGARSDRAFQYMAGELLATAT